MLQPKWGYTADGRARVFEDGLLPDGWSEDFNVLPEALQSSHSVTALSISNSDISPVAAPKPVLKHEPKPEPKHEAPKHSHKR